MSDPVSNTEIEDVLASIRRLVSENAKALKRDRERDPEAEKLVLTPAYRIDESDAPAPVTDVFAVDSETWNDASLAVEPAEKFESSSGVSSPDEAVSLGEEDIYEETSDAGAGTHDALAEAAAPETGAEAGTGADAEAGAEPAVAEPEASAEEALESAGAALEDRIEALETAISAAAPDVSEPDGSEEVSIADAIQAELAAAGESPTAGDDTAQATASTGPAPEPAAPHSWIEGLVAAAASAEAIRLASRGPASSVETSDEGKSVEDALAEDAPKAVEGAEPEASESGEPEASDRAEPEAADSAEPEAAKTTEPEPSWVNRLIAAAAALRTPPAPTGDAAQKDLLETEADAAPADDPGEAGMAGDAVIGDDADQSQSEADAADQSEAEADTADQSEAAAEEEGADPRAAAEEAEEAETVDWAPEGLETEDSAADDEAEDIEEASAAPLNLENPIVPETDAEAAGAEDAEAGELQWEAAEVPEDSDEAAGEEMSQVLAGPWTAPEAPPQDSASGEGLEEAATDAGDAEAEDLPQDMPVAGLEWEPAEHPEAVADTGEAAHSGSDADAEADEAVDLSEDPAEHLKEAAEPLDFQEESEPTSEPAEAGVEDPIEEAVAQVIEAEDGLAWEAVGPEDTPEDVPEVEAEGDAVDAAAEAEGDPFDAEAEESRAEAAEEATGEETLAEVAPLYPEAVPMPPEEEAVLDEAMLREMVAQLVRDELQGTVGERITHNVRRLIRREIARALTLQDFEKH